MKDVLKFLLKLLIFSLILALVGDWLFMAYQYCMMMTYKMLGGSRFLDNTLPYDSSARMIPFIALVLATSRISMKRRLITILVGCAAFFLMDLVGIIIWQTPPTFKGNDESAIYRIHFLVWELFGHWLLPLGIWIFAAKEEIIALLGGLMPGPQIIEKIETQERI